MKLSVLTDYIPWRLNLYPMTLTSREALFLLQGCVRGFRELLHRVRIPFIPDDTMVGIDHKGQVRVWWNQLFHRNDFKSPLTTQVRLPEMVRAIKNMVLSRTIEMIAMDMEGKMSGIDDLNGMEIVVREMAAGNRIEEAGKGMVGKMMESQMVESEMSKKQT